jgi:hypothetical protein
MPLSKIKSKKQAKRLAARQADYDKMSDKTGYTRPGSNKK